MPVNTQSLRFQEILQKKKIPYILTWSGAKEVIQIRDKPEEKYTFMHSRTIPRNEMYFLKQVRKHIETNVKPPPVPKNIKYQNINLQRIQQTKFVTEVDIKDAYWVTALEKGYINLDIYVKGKELHKKTRLAALGQLAKMTSTVEFDGKQFGEVHSVRDPYAGVFFQCSKHISNLMLQAEPIIETAFWWVDAVFVKTDKGDVSLSIGQKVDFLGLPAYVKGQYPCRWDASDAIVYLGKSVHGTKEEPRYFCFAKPNE